MTIDRNSYRFNLKMPLTVVSMSALALALSACQSTKLSSNNLSAAYDNPELAKNALIEAMQKQRRTAYAYQSNIIISNKSRQQALKDATPEQLLMAEDASDHCEHVHDQSYIALMEQAEEAGKDINADDYSAQRQALKNAYLNCDSKYKAWVKEYEQDYYDYDYDAYEEESEEESLDESEVEISQDSVADDTDQPVATGDSARAAQKAFETFEQKQLEMVIIEDVENEESDASEDTDEAIEEEASEYVDFLPNYDSDHTKLDVKKSKLLEAYILKPLSLSSQGIYQPRAGIYTILPTIKFQTRNHITAVNQPIYVDAKTGAIYLWAANFAYPLSENLDDRLGSQWHNKWLKLSLNDGSLPDGFGRDLIKSHFAATDSAYANTPASEYRFLSTSALSQLTPALPTTQLNIMSNARTIVSHQQSHDMQDKFIKHYADTLYRQLSDKYPELLSVSDSEEWDNDDTANVEENLDEEQLYAEAVAETNRAREAALGHVEEDSDVDEGEAEEAEEEDEPLITSKIMVTQFLKLLKSMATEGEDDEDVDAINATNKAVANQEKKVADITYAKQQIKPKSTQPVAQELYGLDNRGQVIWHHFHDQFSDKNDYDIETAEGLNFDMLTQYEPITSQSIAFPNLPMDAQRPTESNSIDLKQYFKDLADYYDDGGGTEAGKAIYGMVQMMKAMAIARISAEEMVADLEEAEQEISSNDSDEETTDASSDMEENE